jgi:hypothetical protein
MEFPSRFQWVVPTNKKAKASQQTHTSELKRMVISNHIYIAGQQVF